MKLFFAILIISTNPVFSQTRLNVDSSSFLGRWRITEIRGQVWVWDANKWIFKQKNDTVHFVNNRIGNFELPKPSDLQNVGFDLEKKGQAFVYFGSGFIPTHWWYKKEKNALFTQQSCGTYGEQAGWTAFIENNALKLKSGVSPVFIMERGY